MSVNSLLGIPTYTKDNIPLKFRHLKRNDWIICPVAGLPEQVTRVNAPLHGRVRLSTSKHLHNRPADELVELDPNHHKEDPRCS